MLPMGVALLAYVNSHTCHGRGLIKHLSTMKSDFSQMRPSRSGFDSECEAFRAEFILNEIKQVGSILLIGCVIMNALNDRFSE